MCSCAVYCYFVVLIVVFLVLAARSFLCVVFFVVVVFLQYSGPACPWCVFVVVHD